MKEAYYFSHDSNASLDEKILNLRADHGWEGYGIYWAIIERLRDTEEHKYAITSIKGLAASLAVKTMVLIQIINEYGLFENDGDYFWSNSLINRMKIVEARRDDARKKGIKSGEVRSGKLNSSSTTVEPELNHGSTTVQFGLNQTRTELEQGKEKKGNIEKKLKENKILEEEEEECLREIFRKNNFSISENELREFIALNSGAAADFEIRSLESRAVLFLNNPKRKHNGRTGKIPGKTGYSESIANADRIIEQLARGK